LHSQLIDYADSGPGNVSNEGIKKSLEQQIGAGRGDINTINSSLYIINRDPFRSIRRGRQIFQRKFRRAHGLGPVTLDGTTRLPTGGSAPFDKAIGAGLVDSCAGCHGRPRGSAGFGGDVATRSDSRDAPHLFGLGLKEMLADEITAGLRRDRDEAIAQARRERRNVTKSLRSKGIEYGSITARSNGTVDTSGVRGVDPDLRVRPFFLHGETISIREFVVGAFNAEMGLDAVDPDTFNAAVQKQRVVTPAGMVLDGQTDKIEAPQTNDINADPDGDGVKNEIPVSLIDHMEFYLLNYFKAGTYEQTRDVQDGRRTFDSIGCGSCHIADLQIDRDRRVADVETVYNARDGIFNDLFATATGRFVEINDNSGHPTLKRPAGQPFLVRNIFTDFKRHDLGPNFHERNYENNTVRREFLTTPLWGVGSSAPYGHDGRSINLTQVILRHGGEAENARNRFASLSDFQKREVLEFLNSLVLFPPDDTASNLDPGNRSTPGFPQFGHGSIRLTELFLNRLDPE
jgi:mono/diheme cytochrome c family protein